MSKVLIIIPTYNRPELCAQAVQSVMDQSFADWELVISKNGMAIHLERYLELLDPIIDNRCNVIYSDPAGLGHGLNAALEYARTSLMDGPYDYFAILDDDDVWKPDFLGRMTDAAIKSRYDVIHCMQEQKPVAMQGNGRPLRPELLRGQNYINFPMCLFKYDLVDRVGEFDNSAGPSVDWDWHLRCLQTGAGYGFLPLVLITHHWHDDNYCLIAPPSDYVRRKIEKGAYD